MIPSPRLWLVCIWGFGALCMIIFRLWIYQEFNHPVGDYFGTEEGRDRGFNPLIKCYRTERAQADQFSQSVPDDFLSWYSSRLIPFLDLTRVFFLVPIPPKIATSPPIMTSSSNAN